MARPQLSIWKRAIFHMVKKIKGLSGGVVIYAEQSNPPIDAEIAEKGRFQTKTSYEKRADHMVRPRELRNDVSDFRGVPSCIRG
jgi:hypothetical protein